MSKLLVGLWLPSGSVCLPFSGSLSLILVHSDSVWLTLALSLSLSLSLAHSRSIWLTLTQSGSLWLSFWLTQAGAHPLTRSLLGSLRRGCIAKFIPPWEVLFIDIQETLAPRCFLCKRKCHPQFKTSLAQVKLTKIFLTTRLS